MREVLSPLILFGASVLFTATLVGLIGWIHKRRQMRDPKSLTYAIETGDWSHWSSTELALAYVMNPFIGDIRAQDALRRELRRRGIR